MLGKPDAVIYEAAMEMMGLPAEAVLAIGDSISHDIKGWQSCLEAGQAIWYLWYPDGFRLQALRQRAWTHSSSQAA